MNFNEALEYINGTQWYGSKPGLERVTELLEKLGRPDKDLKYVHVAGTNGKGSCASMMANILKCCGYKTGLFTSPYLFRFNERMKINGEEIENEVLAKLVEKIKPLADSMEDHPTEFELMTAAAMLWYSQESCDIVVLEVGMGGRFDATNIIEKPEVSVIMNIGLDHTGVLGDTVEKIAFEKAGIIKPGCPCVLYNQEENVETVIENCCKERSSKLFKADFSQIKPEFDSFEGQVFSYKGDAYAISLLGSHQMKNAAVVAEAVKVLREQGWVLEQDDVEHGFYSAQWPARFELVCQEPPVIVDGGHNPQCALTVRDNLLHYFPDKRRVVLLGILGDKDYRELIEILNDAADEYVCVRPNSDRALAVEDLKKEIEKFGKVATAAESIKEGMALALEKAGEDGMVCAVGSLYMAGDVRACFNLY